MSEQLVRYRADRDAFGHMLMDYHQTGEAVEIIEREDGYMDASKMGPPVYFAPFEDWSGHLREAVTRLAPGRVLDLGCGAGRLELHLQAQGVEVTGIDNSPLAVEVCKQRGVKDARLLSITQIGPQLGMFSNVVMLGNNWGLMGSFKRARWLLQKLRRITTPDALILAETNDPYGTESPYHLAYQAYNRERGRMSGQLRLRVHYKNHISTWFDYLIVSKAEMEEIVQGTGWRLREVILSEGSNYVGVLEKSAVMHA